MLQTCDGKVSATKEVKIPFEYEGRWKVGDSCLLIIEKYKENDTK
jgi:hypothetical protein